MFTTQETGHKELFSSWVRGETEALSAVPEAAESVDELVSVLILMPSQRGNGGSLEQEQQDSFPMPRTPYLWSLSVPGTFSEVGEGSPSILNSLLW